MNRSIRFVAIFSLLLTLILLVNLTVIQAFREDEYADNPLNQRGFLESKTIPRGQISVGGQVLASSSPDEEGFYQRSYGTDNPRATSRAKSTSTAARPMRPSSSPTAARMKSEWATGTSSGWP